jgi:flagellar basal body rod protein FlgB
VVRRATRYPLQYAAFAPVARPVRGLLERPDGNNVSVEREGLLLAETQMKFNLGVQLLKDEFHSISQAINSGGGDIVMNLFGMLEVSGSALGAERWRAEVVAANMANAETTRTPEGGAYRRQMLVFRAQPMSRFPLLLAGLRKPGHPDGGVRVERVVADARRCRGAMSRGIPTPTDRVMSAIRM